MADATTAARDRIDQALALLERRIKALRAASAVPDDDLFAMPPVPHDPTVDKARIADLEAAGQAASVALAEAAAAVRDILSASAD